MTDWVRHRFYANAKDPRPLAFPPPGPYWVSGFTFTGSHTILVAYLPEGVEVTSLWPEAEEIESTPAPDGPVFTDRFPRPRWYTEAPEERSN